MSPAQFKQLACSKVMQAKKRKMMMITLFLSPAHSQLLGGGMRPFVDCTGCIMVHWSKSRFKDGIDSFLLKYALRKN
jgi:hypothetical protein